MARAFQGYLAQLEAERAAQHLAAWQTQDALVQLAGLPAEDCAVPWPPSLGDAQPLPCTKPRGHDHEHSNGGLTW